MPYKLNPFTRKLDFYEPSASVDSGEANLASNLGGGEGVFANKSGVTLQFKSILAGSDKTTLASDGSTITIDIDSSEIAHADLNGAGTSTHLDIDSHLGDATKHRVINDSGTAETELWSASKINSEFSSKAGLDHIHFINPRLVLKEQFAGDGEQTVFDLTGIILNGTFSTGAWSADNVLTTEAAHVTKTTKKALYDSLNVFTRNRIAVSSIAADGAVTLDYAPLAGEEFYIWYWYEIQDFDVVDDYYREDFVAEMEATGSEFIDPMTTRGDIILRDSSNYTNRLPVGSAGQVLQSDGSDPSWQTLEAVDVSDFDTEVSNNTDVADNTAHRTSDGSDHSFIDQSVTQTASPTFATPNVSSIQFDLLGGTIGEGILTWDESAGTLEVGMPGGKVNLQIGQEGLIRVRNVTGSDIPNGTAVYISGVSGGRITVAPADNTDVDKMLVSGFTTEAIADNASGYIAVWGLVRGNETEPIDTSSYPAGTDLYLSTSGTWTATHPLTATEAVIRVGIVRRQHASEGEILIRIRAFTIGNDFDGTIRQSVKNKNTGTLSAAGFTAVNDLDHWMTVGIGGSNNAIFGEVAIFYGPGYNDNLYAVDGNKSHKWYNDPTDSHNNSSLNYLNMELSPAGNLTLARGQFTSTLTTGTSPLNVTSTTLNTNLNADLLDGQHGSYYINGSSLGVYGFENQTDTSIGFNDSTYVFTLTDGGSGWSYWRNGNRITISGNKTVTLPGTPPAAGMYFIYIDDESGTLTASTSGWTLVDTKVPVAILEWNNSNTPKYFLANERHQSTMPRRVHFYEHFSEGTQLKSGGLLAGYTVAPVAPADTDNTFSISQVELLDEDLLITSTLLADPNGTDLDYIAYFRTGASTWSWEQSAVPFRYTAAGYIQYDNAGTMTQGAATKYFNWYLCFTNYQNQPRFICVPGQSQFDSSSEAYDEAVSDLDLSGFDIQELIFAYKLTFYTSNSYSSKGKCRLVRAPAFLGIASVSTSISAGATDHNTLGGLQGGTTNEYYHLTATTHGYIDQDVTTTGTPSFTSVTVGNTGLSVGSSTPFSDSSGTLTLQNIDALDATTEATIESAIDTLANLTSVQGHTVTLTGDLVRSGAHSLTFVTTDTTSLTLPTSGTLATTAQISTMVTSSSTITDHAIVRGDGGSRGAQTSTITIDDSDRVQSVKNLGFTSTYDNGNSTASFTLTLSNGQLQKVTLTADSVAMTIVDTGNIGDGQWRITVLQDDTGGRSITSATVSGGTVRTEGGTAPTFSSGIGDEDTMIIIKEGTKYSIQVAATDWQTWT